MIPAEYWLVSQFVRLLLHERLRNLFPHFKDGCCREEGAACKRRMCIRCWQAS